MPVESLWGIGDAPQLLLPLRPVAGLFLAALYLLLLLLVLFRSRSTLTALSTRKWTITLLLALAGFFCSQLLPVQLGDHNPLTYAGGPAANGIWLFPFAFLPLLLAAVTLPPATALLVGLATGAGAALWTTHQVFTPFYVALFGYAAAALCRFPAGARLSRWLRLPLIASPLAQLLLLWLVAGGAFTYVHPDHPPLDAAGWALATMNAQTLPLLLQSFIAGLVAWLFVRFFLPGRATPDTNRPAVNLRRRLLSGYALLAGGGAMILLITIFALTIVTARGLVLRQMAQSAQTVVNLVLQGDVDEQVVLLNLPAVADGGTAFLVGPANDILAHSQPATPLPDWPPPAGTAKEYFAKPRGKVYLLTEAQPEMTLVYAADDPFHPWTVVVTLPSQSVLATAAATTIPLSSLVFLVLSGLGVYLFTTSRSLTAPLTALVSTTRQLAAGRLDDPIQATGEAEIAALGSALEAVRSSMNSQFAELNLLLGTSQVISASLNIQDGMPAVLSAALQGTRAAGARAVVVNPGGGYPLTFAAGDLGEAMANLDRPVASLVRGQEIVNLPTTQQVRQKLGLAADTPLPVRAMAAIALTDQERFQGVLWLGFAQPEQLTESEAEILRTLAGQASVLVANARLFANAEGGRRRLAAVLASTSDAVIVTDQTERVLLINPAMERAFNLRAADVLGRPVASVIASAELRAALLDNTRSPRTRPPNVEIKAVDGRTLYTGASTIFSNDGQVLGRVAVLHDISHLKAIDQMKSEFVSMVSHELRNPLSYMKGFLAMLPLAGEITDEQQEYMDRIASGIEQMSAMIENLLGMGRLEAGVALIMVNLSVKDLLEKTAREQAVPAGAEGLQLVVQAEPDLPVVPADKALVHLALSNLVQNAIKYAPHSGRVILRADCDQNEIIISVQDFGPGIPRADQVRLFEKFYRVKQNGQNQKKGSGLGLAIVKSVAERHGGRVWCESQVGKGSTFYFTLPIHGRRPGEPLQ